MPLDSAYAMSVLLLNVWLILFMMTAGPLFLGGMVRGLISSIGGYLPFMIERMSTDSFLEHPASLHTRSIAPPPSPVPKSYQRLSPGFT